MSSKNVIDLRQKREENARREEARRRSAPPPTRTAAAPSAPLRRVSPLRVRRRKLRSVIALIVLILIGAGVYALSWVSYLPQYSVQKVSIVGASAVPSQLIYDYVEAQLYTGTRPFLSPDNIFLYHRVALEREIEGFFPRISSVTVSRASLLATAVTVTVQERQPFALWCTDDTQSDCYYMDNGGFIFAQAPASQSAAPSSASSTPATSSQGGMYVFEGGIASSSDPIDQTFVGAHMPGIVALLQLLAQAGYTPLGATVESDQDFSVPLAEGFLLKASFGEDADQLVQNLQLILSSASLQGQVDQLEYVDLRFGDRVYYKLKGEAETQTSQ